MSVAAKKMEPTIAYEEVARVVSARGSTWRVDAGAGEYEARRAVSCLVEPMIGDLALVAVVPGGGCYVLAVLERDTRAVSIMLEGDLTMKLPAGRFVVAAAEGVDIVSGKAATVTADEVKVNARTGSMLVESMSYVGTAIVAQVERAKVMAGVLDSTVERLTQRAKRVYRFVEQFEQVRAERLDIAAKKNLSLHAENALVTAEALVKVDGAEIHLG